MGIELNISFNDESIERLERLAARMGHRNLGHTLDLGVSLLDIVLGAIDSGKQVGILESSGNKKAFSPILLPQVKKVQQGDVFCGQVINCENCKKDFTLEVGTVYRENHEHEGTRHVDCPHCTSGLDF